MRVFVDCGLLPPFDPRPYPQDWMLHRDEEIYFDFCSARCGKVAAPQPGDIALFRYGRAFSHGGIVTSVDPVRIIHAYSDAGCVVEDGLAENQALTEPKRRLTYFSLWAGRG